MIYLDVCLLIYAVELHPRWGVAASQALGDAWPTPLAISPLVKLECLVGPAKRNDLQLKRDYESFFERLVLLDMPEILFLHAAQLRGRFGLKAPDALHLACAQHHRCEALWTNDDRLSTASGGLAKMVLK